MQNNILFSNFIMDFSHLIKIQNKYDLIDIYNLIGDMIKNILLFFSNCGILFTSYKLTLINKYKISCTIKHISKFYRSSIIVCNFYILIGCS